MKIRVNYTRRGFRTQHEYEIYGGKTDVSDFDADKLKYAIVKCKNPSCGRSYTHNYTIDNIEERDLVNNPIICTCGSANMVIQYIKPDILPLVYSDDNHKYTNMYDKVIKMFNDGLIHPNFEPEVNTLMSAHNYYGSQSKAIYVNPTSNMLNSNIKDSVGNTRKWKDYPWCDTTIIRDINVTDPVVAVQPQPKIGNVPNQTWLDSKKASGSNPAIVLMSYNSLKTEFPLLTTTPIYENGVATSFVTIKFAAGCYWDWEKSLTQTQRDEILKWEKENNTTYPRKNKKYPASDIILKDRIYNNSLNSNEISLATTVGEWLREVPAVNITIYSLASLKECDCIFTPGFKMLPDVDSDLKTGYEFPPLPLYINPTTNAGSTGTNGTNYTSANITKILTTWPWINDLHLTTEFTTEEGTLYKKVEIPGFEHWMINNIDPYGTCPACTISNNNMYSSLLYITTQIDLDNPIY